MAIDLDVPVMALSQFSREPTKNGGRKPTMADLRDSGAIEQDASIIALLHATDPQPEGIQDRWPHTFLTEIDVAKNRNGETGHMQVYHHRGTGMWTKDLDVAESSHHRRAWQEKVVA